MKKIGVLTLLVMLLVIFSILLTSPFVFAEENDKVEKAYSCLEDKVEDRCEDLSVEELAFTVLATGKCSSELKDKSKDNECWPSGGCRLRDTALAILALDRVGKSTTDAEDWLLEQTKIPTDLIWYLEIDSDEETECKINGKTITIGEDKKISGSTPTCLSKASEYDNYWLKIDSTATCYNKNFTISCDKNFVSTLLYKKKTGSTIYVSSETEFAPAEGSTEHQVNAFCFEQTGCNYEGSLWATFALAKTSHDISSFLPYLIAMEDDNEKYFPSAFLYIITDYDEYFTKIIDEQKNDYWKIKDSSYHQFYDTALALLALYGLDAEQADSAKTYLLEVQGDNGCWRNNIRDTAFILYAAWPKSVSAVDGGGMDDCESYDYYCTSPLDCAQNEVLDNYVCYGGKVCCRTETAEKTCDEKGGITCDADQQCTGATVPASDTTKCCKGSCITKEEIECEEEGYTCRYSCLDDEEEKIYDCEEGEICCAPEPVSERGYWWIWLLVILIILLVIAIIFRNQLRIWLFRMKSKFRRGPAPARARPRPGFPPPPGAMPRARPRMIMPRTPVRPVRRPGPIRRAISKTDRELEETLKKLKEMSK